MSPARLLATAALLCVCAPWMPGCGPSEPEPAEPIAGTALRPPGAGASTRFTAVPAGQSGVDFEAPLLEDHERSYLYHSGFSAGGVGIGDLDGDGRPDLFFVGGPNPNRLYRNLGDFRFEAVDGAGLEGGDAWGAGAALVDVDADGDLDVYVCNYDAPNQLFVNDGAGRFREEAREHGLDWRDASLMPYFADYDRDGDLDVYLLTYRYYRPGGRPAEVPIDMVDGAPVVREEFRKYYGLVSYGSDQHRLVEVGRPDRLLRNDGGRFVDVSAAAGIGLGTHGLSAVWWDFDDDGWLDLYVANDFTDPDRLYRNQGDGSFRDVVGAVLPTTTMSSMGSDVADVDNDGRLDLMVGDMAATTHFKDKLNMGDMSEVVRVLERTWPRQVMRNNLFLNTGTGRFMEVAFLAGVARTDWTWSVKLGDFDLDGKVDLFVTNGSARNFMDSDAQPKTADGIGKNLFELFRRLEPLRERNLAFRNGGDGLGFESVGARWGLDAEGVSFSSAQGDLDGDGDLDLAVVNLGEPVSLYRNESRDGNRLAVRLVGAGGNRGAVGARVRVRTPSGEQLRLANPWTGYLSSNDPTLLFGLGADERVEELRVEWPSGAEQRFSGLDANRLYTITESPTAERRAPPQAAPTQFAERAQELGLDFRHRERPFRDYDLQPLLPGKLSQLGGGLAWGDADGDGDEDVYLAGAGGQAGRLFLNAGDGRFQPVAGPWEADRESEDMAALWLDADSDGALDLFVSSGSVEWPVGDTAYRNRLYLNRGAGRFERAAEGTLPDLRDASGAAVAGDYDGDGDLDLFVGTRSIPGEFPRAGQSRLLRNDAGRFTDVTERVAPELSRVGLVTGALWSDADGDDRLDLLVTLEWGPVRWFRNTGERLEDATRASGLGTRVGWWNAITGSDIDSDGDVDYVVANVGLNTKYGVASNDAPALLYYGDMQGDGHERLVEAKSASEDGLYPVRGKSCSSGAMPALTEKFPTFRSFASASLSEIYTPSTLDEAERFSANHFESGIWRNEGGGRFAWLALPRYVQASPAYGIAAADLDADGFGDVYTVQNLYTREPETGLWRGGISAWLRGGEGGALEIAEPARSGLVVAGDAKGLAVTDLDGDAWPDLVVTQNDDRLLAFVNAGAETGRPLAVELAGPRGNAHAVGARVTARYADGRTLASEVYAGSGYLSQSSPTLFFGSPAQNPVTSLRVRWPDGARSEHAVAGERRLRLEHPGATNVAGGGR